MRQAGAVLAACGVLASGCVTNPATGRWQLSLIGEEQEMALGRQADQEISTSLGVYGDEALERYVAGVGQALAAASERPDLPWTFRVLDDPVINAFALPGGFVYLTRGILSHFANEAQLAAVLGHEIGHVTGRHGVEQMSRAQLGQIGLVVGSIALPELAGLGQVAQVGLGLLLLKHGRDAEREADTLGLRYLRGGGYEPWEMHEVFQMLARTRGDEAAALPTWLSTHPDPQERAARVAAEVAPPGPGRSAGRVEREAYLSHIDGIVFGADPREGFFRDSAFYHPGLAFQLRFPQGWQRSNTKQQVAALHPDGEALVVLAAAGAGEARAAAEAFFQQSGARATSTVATSIGDLPAVVAGFSAQGPQGASVVGSAVFVELDGVVFRILGYAGERAWSRHADTVAASLGSFARLRDPALLAVGPARIEIATLPAATTLREDNRRHPSSVDLETLELLNQVGADQTLAAGARIKRVVGGVAPGGTP